LMEVLEIGVRYISRDGVTTVAEFIAYHQSLARSMFQPAFSPFRLFAS
jgi:hypothetical protein